MDEVFFTQTSLIMQTRNLKPYIECQHVKKKTSIRNKKTTTTKSEMESENII